MFFWDPKRTYSGKITDSKEQNPCKGANNPVGVQAITIAFWNPKVLVATDIWIHFAASIVILPCILRHLVHPKRL